MVNAKYHSIDEIAKGCTCSVIGKNTSANRIVMVMVESDPDCPLNQKTAKDTEVQREGY